MRKVVFIAAIMVLLALLYYGWSGTGMPEGASTESLALAEFNAPAIAAGPLDAITDPELLAGAGSAVLKQQSQQASDAAFVSQTALADASARKAITNVRQLPNDSPQYRYSAETPDPDWAANAERELHLKLSADPVALQYPPKTVRCKTSVCLLEFRFKDMASYEQFNQQWQPGKVFANMPVNSSGRTLPDGGVQVLSYLQRIEPKTGAAPIIGAAQ